MSISVEEVAPAEAAEPVTLGRSKGKQLRSFIDRIARVEQEKKELVELIKGIYLEAKLANFSQASLRILVKEDIEDTKKREKREVQETETEEMRSLLRQISTTH